MQTLQPDVTFVLPCLNEREGIVATTQSLHAAACAASFTFEILIVDNGSTDGSIEVAQRMAREYDTIRWITEPRVGYGHALCSGISGARGATVVTLDADGTYAARDAVHCAQLVLATTSLVLGNRLHSQDAVHNMPKLHRTFGTPLFSLMLRTLFGIRVVDPNCGLRGLKKDLFFRIAQGLPGMEFATVTIARAALEGIPVAEFPVSYSPRIGASKLRTVRDGLRNARSILSLRLKMLGTPR